MDDDLVCNFRKCRKRLTSFAWVTSCSHIFCDEDGTREFSRQCVCPACETELHGQFDITKVDLHPSEQYKSMVLAGHRPETIMEICSRALSFWTYQSHQERAYQEYCASKAIEKAQEQESYYQQNMAVHTTEISSLKSHVTALKKDLELTRSKFNETSEKLMEKSRQYQKLQGMYETLRRRNVVPAVFEDGGGRYTPTHQPLRRQHAFDLVAPEGYLPQSTSLATKLQPLLQPVNPTKKPHPTAPMVPLLGARRVPTEFTVSSSSSSSSSAVPGGGQEAVIDPTIASLVNATANEQMQHIHQVRNITN